MSGALPIRSLDKNQYYFMAYDYDLNLIFAITISNLTGDVIIGAFEDIFVQLKARGTHPDLMSQTIRQRKQSKIPHQRRMQSP